jgi:hypothetical protein
MKPSKQYKSASLVIYVDDKCFYMYTLIINAVTTETCGGLGPGVQQIRSDTPSADWLHYTEIWYTTSNYVIPCSRYMELLGLGQDHLILGQSVSCLAGPLISAMIVMLIRLILYHWGINLCAFVHWKYPFPSKNLVKGLCFSFFP